MKKFLTVLLALSVVFTYTVGSAFAAVSPGEFNANVNAAEAQVKDQLDVTYNNVVKGLTAEDTAEGVPADVAAWTVAAKAVYDASITAMKEKTNDIKNDVDTYGEYTIAELVEEYTIDAYGAFRTKVYAQDDVAARAYFATAKAATISKFNAVDLSVYSTTSKSTKTGYTDKTYYELAKAHIDGVLNTINGYVIAADAKDAAVKAQIDNLNTKVTENLDEIKDTTGKVTGYKLNATVKEKYGLKTITEEQGEALTLEAKKKTLISQMNAEIAKYMEGKVTSTPEALAAAKEFIAAYETAVTFQIESLATKAEADAYAVVGVPVPNDATDKYVANLKKFAELETFAAKYKLEKDADGNLVRDAAKVDAVVLDAKKAAYKAAEWTGLEAAKNEIRNNCGVDKAVKTTKVVETKKAAIEKARKAELVKYYAAEQVEINKFFDKLLADVEAAKTDAEVNAIKTVVTVTVDNKTAVDRKTKASAAYKNLINKIKAYQGLQNAGTTDKKDFAVLNANWVTFVGEAGARTEASIAALYDQAVAKCDAVMTASQVAAAKAAVEAKIDALPKTVTVADKAVVVDAWKAVKEYKASTGNNDIANEATLNLTVKALAAAEKKVAEDAIAALPAVVKITDKAAVKAAKELMDAYNAATEAGQIYAGENKIADTLTAKLTAIKTLEADAVKAAIEALPLNVTLADKAAVEAARAAYDAYVAEYTDYTVPVYAAEDITNADELFKAEAGIEALEEAEKDAAIKATESLKLSVSTKLYKKSNKIRVSWKVKDGDASYIDGYQVYKSTKAQKNYKYMGKTKKSYMDNKKNLKKGTRYFYKVRAYVEIDGQKYYSDWSNKGNRIYK